MIPAVETLRLEVEKSLVNPLNQPTQIIGSAAHIQQN
jgi:hypothetical protein